MSRSPLTLLLASILILTRGAGAQDRLEGFDSPAAALDATLHRFVTGDTAGFRRAYPWDDGRELLAEGVSESLARHPGTARLLRVWGDTALGLLTTHLVFGNSGDESRAALAISGAYRLARGGDGRWRFDTRDDRRASGKILAHRLAVQLEPAAGIRVVDTLVWMGSGPDGASLLLNHLARVSTVRAIDGSSIPFHAGDGLMWVDVPPGRADIVLEYSIDVARDRPFDHGSGFFGDEFGHLRHQYHWHPMIWFDDAADISLTVVAPASVQVAADLPQITMPNGTIQARSTEPSGPLSLFYDTEWVPATAEADGVRFTLFASPGFVPSLDSLIGSISWTAAQLSRRFGRASEGSLSVIQLRSREGAGWPYMSNRAIVSAQSGGQLMVAGSRHRAFFGHEVAHSWTRPTGAARNFLAEGWATFAESILLREAFGAEAEAEFWEEQRHHYQSGDFEGGEATLANDPLNGGLSYSKGAWLFRMLEDHVGQEAFDDGLRGYMSIPSGSPAGLEEFVAELTAAAGADVAPFLLPWLESNVLPTVRVDVGADSLVITQGHDGAAHHFVLELELVLPAVRQRRDVLVERSRIAIPLSSRERGQVSEVIVDPRRRLLLGVSPES